MVTAEQGTLLGGRYQVGPVLGRGGMAEVRRALDTRLSRPVAIKILRIDLAGDSTFQARFRREAQAAAGLNHPNIVSVYDTGEQLDPASDVHIPYIVMELVVGHTLRDLLREGRKILPERALEMEIGVLDALQYSHTSGIIHRDIKPANVMLTSTGQVKVMDFGIARAVADTAASMTQTAAVIGTAQYLSPEQARGETVDYRSDVYSAGCLLYELLVGEPPFKGDSPVSVAYQHVRELPVRPSLLDSVITPEMDAITLKALEKDPDNRYQSAKEMRDDIARLLAGGTPTARLPVVAVPEAAATMLAPVIVDPVMSPSSRNGPCPYRPVRRSGSRDVAGTVRASSSASSPVSSRWRSSSGSGSGGTPRRRPWSRSRCLRCGA
jgi:serine/threonine-protein kinase